MGEVAQRQTVSALSCFLSPPPPGPEESGADEARAEGQAAEEKKEPKVQQGCPGPRGRRGGGAGMAPW